MPEATQALARFVLLLCSLPFTAEGLHSSGRQRQRATGFLTGQPSRSTSSLLGGSSSGGLHKSSSFVTSNVSTHAHASSTALHEHSLSERLLLPDMPFATHRKYEVAWMLSIFLLIAFTSVYGLAFRKKAAKVERHRQPLEQVGPFEEGKHAGELYQRGYVLSAVGQMLYLLWVMLPCLGYIQLVFFTLDEYLFNLHTPDLTWMQLAEPFLLIFAVSHLAIFLQCQYLAEAKVYFMTPTSLADATAVLIENPKELSSNVLVDVRLDAKTGMRYFEFTCVRYLWEVSSFVPVGVDLDVDSALAVGRVKAGGLKDEEAEQRASAGPNVINVEVPSIFGSLVQEFLDPIYCFQFSCIWMYMFYTTWNIASIWLAMVMASGLLKSLCIVRRNQLKLRDLARSEGKAWIQREGKWQERPSGEVVPGDVIRIDEGEVCCDVAIVEGAVVVNESMLTGEPMPVQRFPVDPTTKGQLMPNTHKKHFLFAGTIVMQSAGPEQSRAVGVAVSTSARTAKGDLVRMVLFPSPSSFRFTDDLQQVYAIMFLYVCVLFCVALSTDQGHWIISVFSGLCILAQALNPNLPVSLAIAHAISATRLKDTLGVKCISPPKLPIAGKVHVMVMDKTGTITKDGMDFAGVRPVQQKSRQAKFDDLKSPPDDGSVCDGDLISEEMKWALAGCHTVTKLRNGTLVGNMVECEMLDASGWKLSDDSKSVRCPSTGSRLDMLKPLDFDHHRMTSGQVVQNGSRRVLFVKGSYEAIQALALPATLPADYKDVAEYYAKEQYYVLAVGMRELSASEYSKDRNTLEKGLTLLGLLLFRNEVKPDSPEAIAQLAAGGIRRIICTGDNALTGAAVAQRCNLVGAEGHRTILGEKAPSGADIQWLCLPSRDVVSHDEVMKAKQEEVDLVVTRDAFMMLMQSGELDQLLPLIRVYARMKPTDKVTVVEKHQAAGWIVGMCGDGGNDCGGLRAAHIGLALSDAEASIVAPFSSSATYGTGSKSLMAVVHLIRYGRATLCANLATYSYFMVYGLTLPPAKLTVVFMGASMLPEWHWLFIDIILGAFMVATMTLSWPADQLAARRPTAALLGLRTVFSVLMHVAMFSIVCAIALRIVTTSDFFVAYNPVKDLDLPGHEWVKKGDNYHVPVVFLCLATQLATAGYAFSFGGEHRQYVLRNVLLTIIYVGVMAVLFTLVLGGPSDLHCLFRVNCDQATSKSMYVPVLQEMSTGTLGGCFLGPQFKGWREQVGAAYEFPDKDVNQCKLDGVDPEAELQVSSDAFFWGAAQCLGANNCFPAEFRKVMAFLMLAQVKFSLAAQYLVTMWHPGQKEHFKVL